MLRVECGGLSWEDRYYTLGIAVLAYKFYVFFSLIS